MLTDPPRASFRRTKTWKGSPDPAFDTKLVRIEYAINGRPPG